MWIEFKDIRFKDDVNRAFLGVLDALARKLHAKADLHKAETQVILSQLESEVKNRVAVEEAEDKTYKGMMRAPFGYCPECGEPGVNRELRGGELGFSGLFWDTCRSGHNYISSRALTTNEAAILKQKIQESGSEEKKGDNG